MSSKANAIDDTILWTCLDDGNDDDALVKDMRSLMQRDSAQEEISNSSRVSSILLLRRSIIQCLLHNVLNSKSSFTSFMSLSDLTRRQLDSVSLRGISRLFRMTISLLDVYVTSNVSCDRIYGFLVHYGAQPFLWI
jgi:hypothetical protein